MGYPSSWKESLSAPVIAGDHLFQDPEREAAASLHLAQPLDIVARAIFSSPESLSPDHGWQISTCPALDWPQSPVPLPGRRDKQRWDQEHCGDESTLRNWWEARDTQMIHKCCTPEHKAVQNHFMRLCVHRAISSLLHFSDDSNSVPNTQELFFSATLKQTFLNCSSESLFCTFFNKAWAYNNILTGCYLFRTKCGKHIQKQAPSTNFFIKGVKINVLQVTG